MLRNVHCLILLPLMLAACAARQVSIPFIPGLGPYKIEIQQGNVITREMLAKLQPGMTRSQVRFVLGTPLLVDPFRTDRWDYVYSLDKKGDRVEQRQLRVYFKDDKMVRYEGDLAADAKAGDAAAVQPVAVPVVKPEAAAAVPAVAEPAAVASPVTPARNPDAAVEVKPQLRMAPTEGEPAKPEDRAPEPSPPVVANPAQPESLEAPPLPRLILPPDTPEQPGTPVKP